MMMEVKFGGTVKEQTKLSNLVLKGEKVATSSLLELKKERDLTNVGDIWIIQNGYGDSICQVKVTCVVIKKFKDISESFAKEEGDGSLKNWLDIHTRYYSSLLNKHNRLLTNNTLLECVFFEKI